MNIVPDSCGVLDRTHLDLVHDLYRKSQGFLCSSQNSRNLAVLLLHAYINSYENDNQGVLVPGFDQTFSLVIHSS